MAPAHIVQGSVLEYSVQPASPEDLAELEAILDSMVIDRGL
jgi:hypothetical protein